MKAATDMVSRLMQADKEYKDKKANLKSASEYLGIKDWNIKQRDLIIYGVTCGHGERCKCRAVTYRLDV